MPDEAAAGEPVDDGTLVVRRRVVPPLADGDDDLDATRISGSTAADPSDADRRYEIADVDADTGSTMIVRRESRRRAKTAALDALTDLDLTVAATGARTAASTVAGDVPAPLGRLAQATPPADVLYDRRADGPVIATRTPPPPRVPQAYIDTAATQAAARGRARRRAFAVVAIVCTVVVASVVGIILLAFTG